MHGSFLEIEGRREDLLRNSGVLQDRGVATIDLSSDGSLPENVSAVVLTALNDLAHHLEATGALPNTSWANPFLLTSSEEAEASAIHCEFLKDLETATAWRLHIRDFLLEVTPSLSTPLKLGIVSWLGRISLSDGLPCFHFLALLLEPFIRLTLHMAGKSVLQQAMDSDSSGPYLRVQYSMLDTNGLLATDNIAWFVEHLDSTEKPIAERVLQLAMKCRDAFAHGAVHEFSEDIRRVYGHVIIKAIQLVVEAGVRHLDHTTSQQSTRILMWKIVDWEQKP